MTDALAASRALWWRLRAWGATGFGIGWTSGVGVARGAAPGTGLSYSAPPMNMPPGSRQKSVVLIRARTMAPDETISWRVRQLPLSWPSTTTRGALRCPVTRPLDIIRMVPLSTATSPINCPWITTSCCARMPPIKVSSAAISRRFGSLAVQWCSKARVSMGLDLAGWRSAMGGTLVWA